jgi:hypothetical protein
MEQNKMGSCNLYVLPVPEKKGLTVSPERFSGSEKQVWESRCKSSLFCLKSYTDIFIQFKYKLKAKVVVFFCKITGELMKRKAV